jgi:hypothetical protein
VPREILPMNPPRKTWIAVAVALLMLASTTRADDAKPASSNVPRAAYPRVHPDR